MTDFVITIAMMALFVYVLTILTGGLWLIWILIRYLRSNS